MKTHAQILAITSELMKKSTQLSLEVTADDYKKIAELQQIHAQIKILLWVLE